MAAWLSPVSQAQAAISTRFEPHWDPRRLLNGLYKTELIHRRRPWRTVDDVELATLGWVHWWNTSRLHTTLGDLPPAEYEANHYASLTPPADGGPTG